MKILFVMMAFGFTMVAHANQPLNGTVCHGQRVSWEHVDHRRGIGPGPNGIISHDELKINGKLVERMEDRANGPVVSAVYSVTFDDSVRQEISRTGSMSGGSETYSTIVHLEKLDGSDVVSGWLRVQATVQCTRSWALLP